MEENTPTNHNREIILSIIDEINTIRKELEIMQLTVEELRREVKDLKEDIH